ncbi:hypothetical protein [Curtobacterium sp. MCBD17_040]|uniref:hypothetical protein n=1 Tax=Curtobacterium sp. MCBD17_040 TaxID=2175674 RepID=UPI0011B4B0AB|nr:hypothetical protein [Curtobacterium sp. MCBD17_040]WIB64043.1 hypothetical protein DEI94_02275 [Curtobacterium sp. MCBD17_040]
MAISAWDVWTELVIPASAGGAGVVVAIAALRINRQATQLAKDSELARRADEDRRDREESRKDVLREAAAEGCLLIEWLHVSRPHGISAMVTRPLDGPPPPESAALRLGREAAAALGVSAVPGASLLYALTAHDLPGGAAQKYRFHADDLAVQYRDKWQDRALARIQEWAVDPWESERRLQEELDVAQADPERYARVGLGRGWEDAYETAASEGSWA